MQEGKEKEKEEKESKEQEAQKHILEMSAPLSHEVKIVGEVGGKIKIANQEEINREVQGKIGDLWRNAFGTPVGPSDLSGGGKDSGTK
jgi:hypothetical protein